MFISKWVRSLYMVLVIAGLLLLPALASPAAAGPGAQVYDLRTTVSVSNFTIHPPSPILESIELNGSFEIQAHIVIPPGPPTAPAPSSIVALHLNARGISGTGLTTGTTYRGGEGNTAVYTFDTETTSIQFDSAFELFPSMPNFHPPVPIHPPSPIRVQLTFDTTIVQTESGPQLVVHLISSTDTLDE